jgi:hypothetical protein
MTSLTKTTGVTTKLSKLETVFQHKNLEFRKYLILGIYAPKEPIDKYWHDIREYFTIEIDTTVGTILFWEKNTKPRPQNLQLLLLQIRQLYYLLKAGIFKCIDPKTISTKQAMEAFIIGSLISHCQRNDIYEI